MTYSESSTLRYAGLFWIVRSIRSAVATSAGVIRGLLARVPRRVIDHARVLARPLAASCHTRVVRSALVFLALALAPTLAAADDKIREIVVEENKKTDSDTVILISQLDV